MANPKRGFVLYFDNYPMIIALPPDQRGWLITALMEYAERLSRGEGLPPEDLLTRYPPLSPQTKTAFQFMATGVDRDTQRWLQRQTAVGPGKGRGRLRLRLLLLRHFRNRRNGSACAGCWNYPKASNKQKTGMRICACLFLVQVSL